MLLYYSAITNVKTRLCRCARCFAHMLFTMYSEHVRRGIQFLVKIALSEFAFAYLGNSVFEQVVQDLHSNC